MLVEMLEDSSNIAIKTTAAIICLGGMLDLSSIIQREIHLDLINLVIGCEIYTPECK